MGERISAKCIVILLADFYEDSLEIITGSLDFQDVIVEKDYGKYKFTYVSNGHIEERSCKGFFTHDNVIYLFNRYDAAYRFIEDKIKDSCDKGIFEWVKNLTIIHPSYNKEINEERIELEYEVKNWKRRYRRLSKYMLLLLFIYGVTLVYLG